MTWIVLCSKCGQTTIQEFYDEKLAKQAVIILGKEKGAVVTLIPMLGRTGTLEELEQLDALRGLINIHLSTQQAKNHYAANADFWKQLRVRGINVL